MEMFFDPMELSLNHIQIIVRAMYELAEADQVHHTEMVLLKEFYESCRQDVNGLTDFNELIQQPFDIEAANEILNTRELKETLINSCLFLAFADGTYSKEEKETIARFAESLGIEENVRAELEDHVKDILLMQISRISNIDALKKVAKGLEK